MKPLTRKRREGCGEEVWFAEERQTFGELQHVGPWFLPLAGMLLVPMLACGGEEPDGPPTIEVHEAGVFDIPSTVVLGPVKSRIIMRDRPPEESGVAPGPASELSDGDIYASRTVLVFGETRITVKRPSAMLDGDDAPPLD